jgi:hypothetical protein
MWGQKNPVISSFLISGTEVTGAAGAGGWPWVEIRWSQGSKLVLCGLGLIGQWDVCPAPQYGFLKLLGYLEREVP